MGKDPACLFYWGDWSGGTITFTRHLKGCYMDLLNAQFNNGPLSLDEIKTVLGTDFGSSWPTLQKKFVKGENGFFFNERMAAETEKRKKFSFKQKENIGKRWNKPDRYQTDTKPIPLENGNEDEIGIEEKLKGALDEIHISNIRGQWNHIDFDMELMSFMQKVRGSPEDYEDRTISGLRKAFNYQLRHAKAKSKNGNTSKKQQHTQSLIDGIVARHGLAPQSE